MKQHILAIGAAAALGFAGVTHAYVMFGAGQVGQRQNLDGTKYTPAVGTELKQAAGGVGSVLFAPYYNVQNGATTLINIANTDEINGKVVKVRFRSAANSDDVLDFTLLLSPGDVWSAGLGADPDARPGAGVLWPVITTQDNSCILPKGGRGQMQGQQNIVPGKGQPMSWQRLPKTISDAAQAQLASEGYIEILNMADVAPGSDLFKQIKHVNGVAPCGLDSDTPDKAKVMDAMLGYDNPEHFLDAARAAAVGLLAPSGGIMGSWLIQNLDLAHSYSGNMTAVQVLDASGKPGVGNIVLAPQVDVPIAGDWALLSDSPYKDGPGISGLTGDPLLAGAKPAIDPLWFDLPDMSTPLLPSIKSPQEQVARLDLGRTHIFNFYVSDQAGKEKGFPMWSDWVVSQPTRRYYASVNYNDGGLTKAAGDPELVWNVNMGTPASDYADAEAGSITLDASGVTNNPYRDLLVRNDATYGPMACLTTGRYGIYDTEERSTQTQVLGAFSPGVAAPKTQLCGEVFVLRFSDDSVFSNVMTTARRWPTEIPGKGEAGMAHLNFGGASLPVVGFAATAYGNQKNQGSYGATMPHRWAD